MFASKFIVNYWIVIFQSLLNYSYFWLSIYSYTLLPHRCDNFYISINDNYIEFVWATMMVFLTKNRNYTYLYYFCWNVFSISITTGIGTCSGSVVACIDCKEGKAMQNFTNISMIFHLILVTLTFTTVIFCIWYSRNMHRTELYRECEVLMSEFDETIHIFNYLVIY